MRHALCLGALLIGGAAACGGGGAALRPGGGLGGADPGSGAAARATVRVEVEVGGKVARGSGVIISPSGFVLTAAHLFERLGPDASGRVRVQRPAADRRLSKPVEGALVRALPAVGLALVRIPVEGALPYLSVGQGGLLWDTSAPLSPAPSGGPVVRRGCDVLLGISQGPGHPVSVEHAAPLLEIAGVNPRAVACHDAPRDVFKEPGCSPVDLGPRQVGFVGRDAELASALAALRARQPLLVWGRGGTGKSALLREASYRMLSADELPGGALRVSAQGQDPDALYTTIAAALCRPDLAQLTQPAAKQQRVAALLRDRGAVLIVDDVTDYDAERLRQLIGGLGGVRLALTGRAQPPALEGLQTLHVSDLDTETAVRLLRERLSRRDAAAPAPRCAPSPRGPGEDQALAEIAARLAGNPLALTLAASAMRHGCRGAGAYLAELQADGVQVSGEGDDRLDRYLERVVGQLGEQRPLFDALGVFLQGGFTAEALQAASGLADGAEVIRELAALSLVAPDGGRRYRVHPLLRQLATRRLREAEGLEPALVRMTEHMAGVLAQGQHGSHPEDVRYGVELMKVACQLKAWPTCAGLADLMVDWLYQHGQWGSAITVAGLGAQAAQQVGSERLLLRMRSEEIRVHLALGDAPRAEALMRQNLALLTAPDGRRAAVLTQLARARAALDPREARALLTEAQAILEQERKDPLALLRAALLLADVLRCQDDPAALRAQVQHARDLLQQLREQISAPDQSMILLELGRLEAGPPQSS